MAKAPKATTFNEVRPLGRRRMDPYTGRFVGLEETYVIDSAKSDFLVGLGEVEVVKEGVLPPWAKAPSKDSKAGEEEKK